MAVELVTGYAGKAHVSSSEDGARQAGTVGTGMYALETVDEPLKATLENANTVTVGPGDVLINGRHVQLTGSTTFAVPVGTQGMQTSNLLVLRYELAEDETESVTAITLTGEPAASDPQDPTLATGSVLDGDSPVDMPLYRVITTGIESAQPVKLFETVPPIAGLTLGGLPGSLTSDQLPVVPVSKGGTGATSAAAARANLLVPHVDTNSDLKALRFYSDTASGYNFVSDASLGNGNGFYAYFANNAIGLRQYTNSGSSQNDVWILRPNAAMSGLFQSGRGAISDLSRNTLYNLAPGTYLVNNNATNGPESGNYGNLLVSYSASNRIVGLLAYDNGHVYTTCGASSVGKFVWKRLVDWDSVSHIQQLWSGTWSSGSITVPGAENFWVFLIFFGGFDPTAGYEDSAVATRCGATGRVKVIGGGYSGSPYIITGQIGLSGSTFQWSSGIHRAFLNQGGASTTLPVTRIVGLL